MTDASSPVVIGVDGGGSKTLLAVADRRGRVSALVRGAGTNPFDAPGWRDVLAGLRAKVAAIAPAVSHAAFGLPGYGEAAAISAAQDAAAAAFGFRAWSVLNDVEAAFEAAFAGRPGVLLLAGTGSMLWGRSGSGRDIRVGGWGEGFGDEGSAFWIGRALLGRVAQALDGRLAGDGRKAAEELADALFRHLSLDRRSPQDALLGWYAAQSHPRSAVAALAVVADAGAEAGNAVALDIVGTAADHLARHVEAAWRLMEEESAPLSWSHAGGAFRSRLLLGGVAARLGASPVEPLLPPVGGALLRAARAAGWDPDADWLADLKSSLAARMDRPDPAA